jgi:lactoylglutathione lyase
LIEARGGAEFAFTKIVVRDLAKQVAFYSAVCGYRQPDLLKGDIGGRPIEEIIFRTGEGALDLVLLTYVGELSPSNLGGGITAFYTDDVDACQARVLDAGGSIVEAVSLVEVGTNRMRIGFFADPEGHVLEVMERLTAKP